MAQATFPDSGNVAPANAKKLFNLIRAIAGYKVSRKSIEVSEAEEWEKKLDKCDDESRPTWVRDVMRHTGITYYLKINSDKNKTAMWAGNSPAIIDSNYRAVDGVTSIYLQTVLEYITKLLMNLNKD